MNSDVAGSIAQKIKGVWGIQTRLSILDAEIGEGLGTYLLQHPSGLTPICCKSWEDLRASDARLALVGADFWEDVQAAQLSEKGML